MLVALALLIAVPQEALPLPMKDGGFCVGLGWMSVNDPAGYSLDRGPDFTVVRYDGKDGRYWGAYSGMASQVSDSNGTVLLKRDGVTVRRAIVDGTFRGYLATRHGQQNHFFGSIFKNAATDRAFFDRIDFGPRGQTKCESYWKS